MARPKIGDWVRLKNFNGYGVNSTYIADAGYSVSDPVFVVDVSYEFDRYRIKLPDGVHFWVYGRKVYEVIRGEGTKGRYQYTYYAQTDRLSFGVEALISVLDNYSEEDWDNLTEEERQSYLHELGIDLILKGRLIDWGWE